MTLGDKLYARRNGGMVFWRIGCIGGSFYITKSDPQVSSFERSMQAAKRRATREALRRETRRANHWQRLWAEAHFRVTRR